MKPMISKYLLFIALLVILAPSQSLAINREGVKEIQTEKFQGAICSKLTTISTTITNRMTAKEGKVNERQNTWLMNLKTKRDQRKTKLEEHRIYWDDIRTKKYTELEAKASTDEQKQAVTTFQNTVEAAVKTRREAIDAAITQFQADVDALVTARQSSVDQSVEKYKNSVQTALSKAQTDCAAGTDPVTVRVELKSNLDNARTTLQTDRSNIDKVSDSITTAVATRKASFEAAWTTFKVALKAAQDTLKQALNNTTQE